MTEQRTTLGSIHALASGSTRNGESVWYAACEYGLYRSQDGGQTWQDSYATLRLDQPLTTASIALSPDFPHDRTLFAGALGGVLRSTDAGTTWAVAELPSPPPYVVSLIVSPSFAEDGLVFAGTLEDGVFRSWDRGASWASWNFGLLDLNVFCLAASHDFAHDDTLYAGVESGVFRSTNGGRAWRETAFPMDLGPVLSLSLSPGYAADNTIYAGTESSGVYRSTDGGESWSPAGLQQCEAGIDNLFQWQSSPPTMRLAAVTHTCVFTSDAAQLDWSGVEVVDAGIGAEITAAAVDVQGEEPAILTGTIDGGVRRLPLTFDPT